MITRQYSIVLWIPVSTDPLVSVSLTVMGPEVPSPLDLVVDVMLTHDVSCVSRAVVTDLSVESAPVTIFDVSLRICDPFIVWSERRPL